MRRYKPIFPQLLDTSAVQASVDPRPMVKSDDASRAEMAAKTGGDPMVAYDGHTNPYIDYQSIGLLLSLQNPRSEGYDGMCFFVMGQISDALVILSRAAAYVDHIADTWNILSTITTQGFNAFRDHLSTASGQLSFMYRHVEFVLGNKSRRLATAYRNVPHVWPAMKKALHASSLYDVAIGALHRAGHRVDDAALKRDWSEPYAPNPSVAAAWLRHVTEHRFSPNSGKSATPFSRGRA